MKFIKKFDVRKKKTKLEFKKIKFRKKNEESSQKNIKIEYNINKTDSIEYICRIVQNV